ncbi:hypothetical protein BSY15_1102 [Acidovorax sp. RAC01]|nr:hypothetical protein BSY15_1102 [Acidovorax sp. RAC01]
MRVISNESLNERLSDSLAPTCFCNNDHGHVPVRNPVGDCTREADYFHVDDRDHRPL